MDVAEGDMVVQRLALTLQTRKVVGLIPSLGGLSVWTLHVLTVSAWVLQAPRVQDGGPFISMELLTQHARRKPFGLRH